ncbi:HSF-type DNA-binding-domain-containing protein [Mycena alexandri]|uniref:HSF-type DNA-binding-domain-containing protein n=1 Tax=Mycena alexandri TaxID=1745969 RepID=A0AAD6T1K6_9AGAR|nr:HSF-type DNA-binding-domain-containing protein [Mycena alexandri]
MDEQYPGQQPLLPLISIGASRTQDSPTQALPAGSTNQLPSLGVKCEGAAPEHKGDRKEGHEDTTSDFVKKLYRMLEDRSFQDVVSWGCEGDCFVVKNTNEFAKSILPRMFKHSNFSSFVRQLNKYDFHKVKNTDENLFGEESSWTFRHPDFHEDRRDALENIKRKGPRKSTAGGTPLQRTPSSSSHALVATSPNSAASGALSVDFGLKSESSTIDTAQTEIATLHAKLSSLGAAHEDVFSHVRNLERSYQEVLVEMVGFQRGMAQQDGLMQSLMHYLLRENNADKMNRAALVQMREIPRHAEAVEIPFGGRASGSGSSYTGNVRLGASVGTSGVGAAMGRMDILARVEELQAQRVHSRLNTPLFTNAGACGSGANGIATDLGEARQQQMGAQRRTESPEPTDYEDEMVVPTTTNPSSPDVAGGAGSDGWSMAGGDAHAHARFEVHTVGHLTPRGSAALPDAPGNCSFDGDACADEMVGKQVSYASMRSGSGSESLLAKQPLHVRQSISLPGWAMPPHVLLVDDDAVTRKLSSKFLQVFGCTIDVAVDGVGAVNKMNLENYDLVLMDIVMPKLDGVSATSMIRKFDPQTPIISMTSNSKPTEIMTYYSCGMNDILPKPFTKQGLFDMLEKHLTEKMSTSMCTPRQPSGIPPLNDAGFEGPLQAGASSTSGWSSSPGSTLMDYNFGSPNAGDGRISILAGMWLSDEQYNIMPAEIVGGGGFNCGEKRVREMDEGDPDGRDGKRGRFEISE